ncbi:UNVERIFIED_CONTAM: hypothetical protein Sradi_0178500 [Sesamum radiatum]|uniref:Uncharacterized protein n=1 Tax=Sesamum radiatum TaxID=300843 RepID=A0AAW2W0E0_SESRA
MASWPVRNNFWLRDIPLMGRNLPSSTWALLWRMLLSLLSVFGSGRRRSPPKFSSCVEIWGKFIEDILEDVLGEVVAEIQGGTPGAEIESEAGDVQPEGAPAPNEGEVPRANDEAISAAPLTAIPPGTQSETKEDPACGDKK